MTPVDALIEPAATRAPHRAGRTPQNGRSRLSLGRAAARLSQLYGVRPTRQGVLFVYPPIRAEQVSIAGDFNHWIPADDTLLFEPDLGVWQGCIVLGPGRYRYRLVIDGRWSHDWFNPAAEPNGLGQFNSVICL